MEIHPRSSICLDHTRLAVLYSQGVILVLSADLDLMEATLAAHLESIAEVIRT